VRVGLQGGEQAAAGRRDGAHLVGPDGQQQRHVEVGAGQQLRLGGELPRERQPGLVVGVAALHGREPRRAHRQDGRQGDRSQRAAQQPGPVGLRPRQRLRLGQLPLARLLFPPALLLQRFAAAPRQCDHDVVDAHLLGVGAGQPAFRFQHLAVVEQPRSPRPRRTQSSACCSRRRRVCSAPRRWVTHAWKVGHPAMSAGVTEGTRTPDLRDHNPLRVIPGRPSASR
jgi:hypothetical protein